VETPDSILYGLVLPR